jgi:hypothetical protein
MARTKKNAVELKKLIVDEVSVVDSPANGDEFRMFKRATPEETSDLARRAREVGELPEPAALEKSEPVDYDRAGVRSLLKKLLE